MKKIIIGTFVSVATLVALSASVFAEEVAKVFIKGIRKRKYNILPGEAKMVWLLYRYFPRLVRSIMDGDYKKARKRLGKY